MGYKVSSLIKSKAYLKIMGWVTLCEETSRKFIILLYTQIKLNFQTRRRRSRSRCILGLKNSR